MTWIIVDDMNIQIIYRLTKKTGEYITYYPNGNIGQRWNYVNGKLNGKSFVYYEDGKLLGELSHKNNLLDGETHLF